MLNINWIWQFWLDQISPKMVFAVENRKNEHRHWILHIWVSPSTKYQLKLIIWNFLTKFTQKGHFRSKTEKGNTSIEFYILELVKVPNFSLNWQFLIFGPNLPQKGVYGLKQKNPIFVSCHLYRKFEKLSMKFQTSCSHIFKHFAFQPFPLVCLSFQLH